MDKTQSLFPLDPSEQTRFYRRILDGTERRAGRPLFRGKPPPRVLRLAALGLLPFLAAALMGLLPVWPAPQENLSRNCLTRPASRIPLSPAGEKALAAQRVRAAAPLSSGAFGQSVSRPASLAALPAEADMPFFSHRGVRPGEDKDMLVFALGRVFLDTSLGKLPLDRFAEIFPKAAPVPETAISPLPGLPPDKALLLAGAVFCDRQSEPLVDYPAVWLGEGLFGPAGAGPCSLKNKVDSAAVSRLISGLDLSSVSGRAGKYRAMAEAYARKYTLAPSLVLAIMHTESNFNPLAVSAGSALGLMQIVPETAGNEVYRYLRGARGEPTMETLFSPESNIHYGTAYLHLLARRYFHEVIDPASREMCVIAGYNGGPGAVLRLFDPDREVAVARINALTSEEVYATLTTRMPNLETRRYVEVVLEHQRSYAR
ncbi:MAG: transglycosylase SLT domain-containing protein [Deltaproteobacteria bacterium]|jgi:membrane-bound lytic murein transglycosylase C|nr:transglycosylase SLT domain-containing protein [Deltaproteobacteria bacterium]